MLVSYRCASLMTTVENSNMLAFETSQDVPQGTQVGGVECLLLRDEVDRVEHELRANDAELVEDQFMLRSDQAKAEIGVVVCKSIYDLFLG